MQNFEYQNPTRIVFGEGQIARLSKLVPADARVLVLYGGGSIKGNGTYDEVMAALGERVVFEYAGVEPNPTYETLMGAVELIRRENLDFMLAVGGGSVADGAKFVAAAVSYEGDPWEMMTNWGANVRESLPFGVVLTLPATGSEMNSVAVISRKSSQDKLAFGHRTVYPQFSILDPTKTYSLPPHQVANGVVDTFVHVIEQYLTYPAGGHVQDRFAEGLLLTLIEFGPQALETPENYEVRATLMWASTLALNGLIAAGVPSDWATHSLGHEITALYGVDHAQTLAVLLPAMLELRREEKRAKLLQYGARVWGITQGEEGERIDCTIDETRRFFERMGAKTRLAEYGIQSDAVDRLVAQLERHGMTKLGEHGSVDLDLSRRVYELAR